MNSGENIRNFVITAHIDHGKSTLADRLLEATGTVEKRLMKAQYLDSLELERERGITIKMAPVRMKYSHEGREYTLNLIDTPGHSDFGYEVSRALAAVEGAVLLVDATQGIQAQTLANFESARKAGLTVIGAVNKIDVATPEQVEDSVSGIAELISDPPQNILRLSGKTGEGVAALLQAIITRVPPPRPMTNEAGSSEHMRALVFDSLFDDHKGIIAFVRVFDGEVEEGKTLHLLATGAVVKPKEVGYFLPQLSRSGRVRSGETGYIATGVKDPASLRIGDTIADAAAAKPLPGYKEPKPVVFVSFYPEDPNEYENLSRALGKLHLTDAALTFEPDMSEALGRGFKGGFLGRLHFEITAERLEREFKVATVHSFPSVAYRVRTKAGAKIVTNPKDFPADALAVLEPVVKLEILTPPEYLSAILGLRDVFRFSDIRTETVGKKVLIKASLPLADLVSDLDDRLKSLSRGYASLSYELADEVPAEVAKLEIMINGNPVPGLTRIVPKSNLEREGRRTVERLKELLPKEQFSQAIQAAADGRIIARETISPMKKDVTGYLYGGDRTRKMKLWKKQARGKERLKEIAAKSEVKISANIFKELLKK